MTNVLGVSAPLSIRKPDTFEAKTGTAFGSKSPKITHFRWFSVSKPRAWPTFCDFLDLVHGPGGPVNGFSVSDFFARNAGRLTVKQWENPALPDFWHCKKCHFRPVFRALFCKKCLKTPFKSPLVVFAGESPCTPWPEARFPDPRGNLGGNRRILAENSRFHRLFSMVFRVPCRDPEFSQKVAKTAQNQWQSHWFWAKPLLNASLARGNKFVKIESKQTRFSGCFGSFAHLWGFNVFWLCWRWFWLMRGVPRTPVPEASIWPPSGPISPQPPAFNRGF